MKKVFLIGYILISTGCLVAQNPPLIDSADVQTIGTVVFDAATNGGTKELINGVPNAVTGGLFTAILALIGRFIEKRKLRKAGKLVK